MNILTYEQRVKIMAEKLARVSVFEMAQIMKEQGLTNNLGDDLDKMPGSGKNAAIGAHTGRAKAALAEVAEAIRETVQRINGTPNHWIDGFLIENGYIPDQKYKYNCTRNCSSGNRMDGLCDCENWRFNSTEIK